MFLTRRNILAWILIVLSAAAWTYGCFVSSKTSNGIPEETIETLTVQETDGYSETFVSAEWEGSQAFSNDEEDMEEWQSTETNEVDSAPAFETAQDASLFRLIAIFSYIASLILAVLSIFFLYPPSPLHGPDGAALIIGFFPILYRIPVNGSFTKIIFPFLATALMLLSVRELYGWLRNRFPFSWCLCGRIAAAGKSPQWYQTGATLWTILSCLAFLISATRRPLTEIFLLLAGTAISALSGFFFLWKYGRDFSHFEKQLDHFQNGRAIAVKEGSAFSSTETKLLDIQEKHKDAIHTAVTSERFKVELISNVSHDLRTPLTAILGYGELLKKESLSETGEKQLFYLNQKAGYMRDLVEDLFELTKVSSGVIETKKEEIDLIRLLEQTIGLFDDQLVTAGLLVRRHYKIETAPIVTDGARIHQVIANLLGNAIKYALAGTRIHLEADEDKNYYRIRMTNTASYEMDFEPEEILQRFSRGDKARSTKGSGLGLAIAQTYTESVGGQFHISIDGDQFNAMIRLPKN